MKITIEDIQAGLNKHGLKLGTGRMYDKRNECCCTIGATLLKDYDSIPENFDHDAWDIAFDKFGMSFIQSFYPGFDKIGTYSCSNKEVYENGKTIRQQAEELGLIRV